eukprot:scaffold61721_cov57-Phaeocystis_antarctica.AAC.1
MSYYLLVPLLLLLPPLLSGGADLGRDAAATLHLARRGGVRARRRTERRAHAGDRRRDRPRRVARVDPDGARGEPAAATRGQGAPGQEAAVRLTLSFLEFQARRTTLECHSAERAAHSTCSHHRSWLLHVYFTITLYSTWYIVRP